MARRKKEALNGLMTRKTISDTRSSVSCKKEEGARGCVKVCEGV